MFTKADPQLEQLNEAIDKVFKDLDSVTSDDAEYDRASDQLVKLMKLREELSSKRRVSPDVLAGVVANIAAILMIVKFERTGPIVSKALGFVQKLR